jgi:hypothetical protein
MDAKLNKKSRQNQKYYEKTKKTTDAILLRLAKGGKEAVDQMAVHFGVARPALFDLYLLPFLGVIAKHQGVLQELAQRSGCSIPTLIERLILRAQTQPDATEPTTDVAASFDALFASSDGET